VRTKLLKLLPYSFVLAVLLTGLTLVPIVINLNEHNVPSSEWISDQPITRAIQPRTVTSDPDLLYGAIKSVSPSETIVKFVFVFFVLNIIAFIVLKIRQKRLHSRL